MFKLISQLPSIVEHETMWSSTASPPYAFIYTCKRKCYICSRKFM